jgi:hypothetical protein
MNGGAMDSKWDRQEACSPRNRFRCTATTPWDPSKGEWVEHEGAREVGDQEDGYPGGDIVTMQCPHCGTTWRKELPQ